MATIKELRDYEFWVGKSPFLILMLVSGQGGWSTVFPKGKKFPLWASRVRNFFNETPTELRLMDAIDGRLAAAKVNRFAHWEDFKAAHALSGDVYEDRQGRRWYEMHTAGTGYHFSGKADDWKAARLAVTPQAHVPVFKLVSPDGSGGSRELCVHNWQLNRERYNPVTRGKSQISRAGKWRNIRTKVVINEVYKGSYNYSETVRRGFGAHERMDMKTHRETRGFYVDPSMWSPMASRRFPAVDRRGDPIAASR